MLPGTFNSGGRDTAALNNFEVVAPQVFHRVREMTGLPISGCEVTGYRFLVDYRNHRLCLVDMLNTHHKPFSVDLDHERRDLSGSDLLRRAMGRNVHSVIDATAGFGADAIHFARIGFEVIAIERCPTVAALFADALGRVGKQRLRESIRLVVADSVDMLGRIHADAVYIDPMYATAARLKSLPRRAMVLARELAGDDLDAGILLDLARSRYARVVVKRPDKSEPLAGGVHHRHVGKTVRYDVYVNHDVQSDAMNPEQPVPSTDEPGSH